MLVCYCGRRSYKKNCFMCICSEDMFAQESIDLLQTCGLQFKKHEEDGIDAMEFAELLMTSGIVLIDNVKWLSFHRYGNVITASYMLHAV
jgi:hypothetical protein